MQLTSSPGFKRGEEVNGDIAEVMFGMPRGLETDDYRKLVYWIQ